MFDHDCSVLGIKGCSLMGEPEPEPSDPSESHSASASAPTTVLAQGRDNWYTANILVKVADIDHSRTPRVVELTNPAVSGDQAAKFVNRRIVHFYKDSEGNLPDIRFYVVWRTPRVTHNPQRFAGLHFAVGDRAYRGLTSANDGDYRGVQWIRVANLVEARKLFIAECTERRVQLGYADRIFIWQ